jgi:hypothetical protein
MSVLRASLLALATLLASGCVCPPGEASCNGECVALTQDRAHCGACGRLCGRGQLCIDGECRGSHLTGVACEDDARCDDGSGCTGIERCVNGVCRDGERLDCDDGVACTVESCEEPGFCVSVPDSARCGGERCTGTAGDGCGF